MKANQKARAAFIDAELFKAFQDVFPDKKECLKAVNEAKRAYQSLFKDDYFGNSNLVKNSAK